ncbi:Uncharacterised protein [Budvicia aquatica]|uniref:Uncharacterized protein n=1 Tax=Budvicia aquatica TaxID=82979 RepID=A0A2C6DHP1_9GAMM|nr:hypothetical protein CRN84_02745 [Budvicia aquatica]VFS46226.1 Uncharacterised protein [Budvicia aquatica]
MELIDHPDDQLWIVDLPVIHICQELSTSAFAIHQIILRKSEISDDSSGPIIDIPKIIRVTS